MPGEKMKDVWRKYARDCLAASLTRPDAAAAPMGPLTQAELDAFAGLDSKSQQLFLMWADRAMKAEAALSALSRPHRAGDAK
jgi:hypothetical protein